MLVEPTQAEVRPSAGIGVLIRVRLVILRNLIVQGLAEGPLKIAISAAFIVLIWLALFSLFRQVFESFRQTPAEGAVVVPVIFNIFFLSLLVLLGFSNAILVYGSLFRGKEPGFLLASPLPPVYLILVKYVESLFFASWSLILLGLPLMLAIAQIQEEALGFYPLFVAFFLSFVPIPAALGLIAAWAVARYSPRSGSRALLVAAGVVLALSALWAIRLLRANQLEDAGWVKEFFSHMDFVETAILPSTWVSRGIEFALRGDHATALGYLAVTLSNGLFTSLLAVALCARRFGSTFDRAVSTASRRPGVTTGWRGLAGGLCEVVFCYLPVRLRLIAAKDLRTFLRDPLQWSQLVILFGLMGLYLMNLPQFAIDLAEHEWGWLVPFLNLCAITLILATFTSRFVFPLVSLEGHQLWLIGLLPLSRRGLLAAKFAYALTITSIVSVSSSVLAAYSLEMGWAWGALNIVVTLSICIGLCGLAVGLGARFPMFTQTNAGRIANGVGGTINLIVSVVLVVLVLAGMAIVTHRARTYGYTVLPDMYTMGLIVSVISLTLGTGWAAMRLGGRHLDKLEV